MNKFEWYKPRSGRPYVSIVRYRVSFSDGLIKEMGRPEYVKLGYSDESKSMVIKPCISDDEYKIKVTGGKTPRILSRGFIRFLISEGIKIEDKAKKYIAIWNEKEKICCVELKS
ncbi:hypothetical protein ES708_26005 [subsurface metagenome]